MVFDRRSEVIERGRDTPAATSLFVCPLSYIAADAHEATALSAARDVHASPPQPAELWIVTDPAFWKARPEFRKPVAEAGMRSS